MSSTQQQLVGRSVGWLTTDPIFLLSCPVVFLLTIVKNKEDGSKKREEEARSWRWRVDRNRPPLVSRLPFPSHCASAARGAVQWDLLFSRGPLFASVQQQQQQQLLLFSKEKKKEPKEKRRRRRRDTTTSLFTRADTSLVSV